MASLDTGEFTPDYPASDWGYLERGVLILFQETGLIYYASADDDLELLGRSGSAEG